ncbi:hypothetical protein BABINDRAFT_31717 [Babjeviella inositovora NRRL Y-12698]|uniref:GPI transamidase component PIG-S n=1 Tax=Babjeviella inositovora NRRL Y-12698 TaxID=984486 RepID=A0A1E3QZZ3_9ASCO|nr:uncharacterized protein BABINDRAFT_31717 [Babjeviella inositovora NRRL Y-12698]ODQ83165.1 hypothetical protein BABINDRAFT_31717 [Babjeviella inositovora NRRL Y-12698]
MPAASSGPKPETPREKALRRQIVAAFVLVVFLFGLPLWYITTLVHRAELPASQVHSLQKRLERELRFEVPVYIDLSNAQQTTVSEAQSMINQEIQAIYPAGLPWNVVLKRGRGGATDYSITLKRVQKGESIYISPYSRHVDVYLSDDVIAEKKVTELILKVVVHDLFRSELEKFGHIGERADMNVVPYAPSYHLTFSLLYEGGQPVAWDIQETWNRYMKNFLQELQPFANFTVDSQIQYYSKLVSYPAYNPSCDCYLLTEADLSTFVNYGDWNLDAATAKQTLNFIVYIPAKDKPFRIQDSTTNTFIVPRWGAVKVLNKNISASSTLPTEELIPIMETFASSLLQLLGAPKTPLAPKIRIDILTRTAIHQNLHQSVANMFSLLKLVEKLDSISIPKVTLVHMQNAISAVEHSLRAVKGGDWVQASRWAAEALVASNTAFFEENMVQQMYFPDEHKFAVYMPLCGPVLMVTLLGVFRVVRELKA